MKKNKLLLLTSFIILSVNANAQTAVTTNLKASANLTAYCSIQASNIFFGLLPSPLNAQSSFSSINVLCSKSFPYTINMAYGGIYGKGNPGDGSWWELSNVPSRDYVYLHYSYNNQYIGYRIFPNAPSFYNTISCYRKPEEGNSPRCYEGTPAYGYGKLNGLVKGNTIGYAIEVPEQPSKVWNSGVNSYQSFGTGEIQNIAVKANIIPSQSSSLYPAEDSYMDQVTVSINY